jgi:ABC-type uncharacterized transport system involved in gliding motility auxiliary subunit
VKKISHLTSVKADIKNPNRNIIEVVIKNLLKKYNAKSTSEVVDFYGNRQKVDFGIAVGTKTMGVKVSDTIEFVGDRFLLEELFEEFQRDFKKLYISIAVIESLKSMGYDVKGREVREGILIDAFR